MDSTEWALTIIAMVLLFGCLFYAGATYYLVDDIKDIKASVNEAFYKFGVKLEDSFAKIGIKIDLVTDKVDNIQMTLDTKPTATATSTATPRNLCKPLSTKSGYGLVNCPVEGMTVYYCDGKPATKELANCCHKSPNTGECY